MISLALKKGTHSDELLQIRVRQVPNCTLQKRNDNFKMAGVGTYGKIKFPINAH